MSSSGVKFITKCFVILLLSCSSAFALSAEERLADELQEQRARALFMEVRCIVCGGQVIENSDSNFSFEMRQLIRQKILAGENDAEIKKYLVKEFGSDILVNPELSTSSGLSLMLITMLIITASTVLFIKFFVSKK